MAKYLDENGLQTLWGKITDKIAALKCYDTGVSDTAGTWTVTIPGITALAEGLTIKIRLKTSYNGTTNTLNLNGLGAKTIYFRYGNKLTSHYSKESVLALTYTTNAISSGNDRTGWIIENIYDSTNTYQLRKYYTRYKTKSALYRYMICFINKDDELIPANNVSNSTATTKALTTESFMLSKGIYYYNSTTTVAAAGYTGNATLYQQLGLVDLRYSFNTGTTLTANKPVYLVVKPQIDGQVKLASTPIVQTVSADPSNLYVFLGTAYDKYRIELTIEHPIYVYRNEYYDSLDISHERDLEILKNRWTEEIYDTLDGVASIAHDHSNKSILDNTTASFTTALKTKLDGIETGANKTTVDASLSSTSTNPVQNKAIKTALDLKADDQLPEEITTTEGDKFNNVGDAIVGINNAMLILVNHIPNYSAATSSSLGLVKLGSDTVQSTAANGVTSTSSRTYAVQKNSSGQLVVNVPWTTSSASIPSELAKLVNSGGNYIQIERYGSNNYGMRIQTGKVSVNKAETIHTEVKFPNSSLFSNTPVVILTPVINNTADTRQIDTELTGVTNKGFHFSCALGNTSYRITEVHYIAIQLI